MTNIANINNPVLMPAPTAYGIAHPAVLDGARRFIAPRSVLPPRLPAVASHSSAGNSPRSASNRSSQWASISGTEDSSNSV
ncbi:hypothetical protein GCM10007285_13830 [Stappia taiwanensis]|nr:hypothetical protein GCM10007285_13830 [Stappia taiwanensis]